MINLPGNVSGKNYIPGPGNHSPPFTLSAIFAYPGTGKKLHFEEMVIVSLVFVSVSFRQSWGSA
jgi:hypothetical protein